MSHFVLSASSAVPIPSQTLPNVLVVSPANCCATCSLTILELKFAVEPRQNGINQAAWTTATAGILSKRTACSVDLALSFLMTNSCVPIVAPSTRKTLTIHWQIETNSPENGSLPDFLGCPGQCVRPGQALPARSCGHLPLPLFSSSCTLAWMATSAWCCPKLNNNAIKASPALLLPSRGVSISSLPHIC